MSNDEVLVERIGSAGVFTLNRPQALNAVTLGMVRAMRKGLDAFVADPAVSRIIIRANGGRAFSAGGDIRDLTELGKAGRHDEMLAFWREEYDLNILIHHCPKPYIALIDGIVMGGGAGVSVHGSHVVAGENFAFAMPEVNIGFFPDIGATYFLPRLREEIGTYLALTGNRMKQADALATGFAHHAVASGRMGDLFTALTGDEPVDAVLARFAHDPGSSGLMGHRGSIRRCFAFDTVEAILAALDHDARALDTWCEQTAATIRAKCPTSLKLALAQMRRGKGVSLIEAMQIEWRIVNRVCRGHDFYEGVRAVIIDKDNAPRWKPATLDGVSEAAIDAYFAPLPVQELVPPPLPPQAVA